MFNILPLLKQKQTCELKGKATVQVDRYIADLTPSDVNDTARLLKVVRLGLRECCRMTAILEIADAKAPGGAKRFHMTAGEAGRAYDSGKNDMSETKFLPFALPDIGEDEINEVVDALRSGWVTTGPKTKQFEADFAQFIGDGVEAIAVNSATAGLHLALEAIGIGPGDEVIVPSYTFTATAEVVRYLGADPVCVDVDAATFNIRPDAIRAAITAKTKAIMPVHFAGLACAMDEIIAIAREHGLKVVEDAAHALPTYYKGKLVGTLDSDVTVFSFYANKTMTTGEGGMVVSKNKDIIARCKVMRLHGISRDAFDRYVSKTPAWFYEVVAPGFKYNMPDTAAAMGIHQLKKIRRFQELREAMAQRFDRELADLPLILPARLRMRAAITPGICTRCASSPRPASAATTSSPGWRKRHRLLGALHSAASPAGVARRLSADARAVPGGRCGV